jgi:F0F1-type ATP synthase assembly protein I
MIKNLLGDNDPAPEAESKATVRASNNSVLGLFDSSEQGDKEDFVISHAEPESMEETTRRSGLAYSAGIAFFAAVVFMLILGWGADVLLGTSPWGIVGVIVLGSVIGFVQFFRLTSQIFKK